MSQTEHSQLNTPHEGLSTRTCPQIWKGKQNKITLWGIWLCDCCTSLAFKSAFCILLRMNDVELCGHGTVLIWIIDCTISKSKSTDIPPLHFLCKMCMCWEACVILWCRSLFGATQTLSVFLFLTQTG